MKTAPAALLAAAALIFASVSCDKHSWEETQVLHEGMHKGHGDQHHGDTHHAEEAKGEHAKPEAHAAPEAHGEKKEDAKH